jgi:hypothetical protein
VKGEVRTTGYQAGATARGGTWSPVEDPLVHAVVENPRGRRRGRAVCGAAIFRLLGGAFVLGADRACPRCSKSVRQ